MVSGKSGAVARSLTLVLSLVGCGGSTSTPDQNAGVHQNVGGAGSHEGGTPISTTGTSAGGVGATEGSNLGGVAHMGGIANMGGGGLSCGTVPSIPPQPANCPQRPVPGFSPLPACDNEGQTCQILVPTGLLDTCLQPPRVGSITCCDHAWSSSPCSQTGAGGAAGAGGASSVGRCHDAGWGLTSAGVLRAPRGAGDVPIGSTAQAAPGGPSNGPLCQQFNWWHCHLGSRILGASAATPTPIGTGGTIRPGAYALVNMTAYGGVDPDLLVGVGITQTLYFSPSSVLFESDDDHRFSFTGANTYSVKGAALKLVPTCESGVATDRQWSLDLTFTATATELKLFSSSLGYGATFELVPTAVE